MQRRLLSFDTLELLRRTRVHVPTLSALGLVRSRELCRPHSVGGALAAGAPSPLRSFALAQQPNILQRHSPALALARTDALSPVAAFAHNDALRSVAAFAAAGARLAYLRQPDPHALRANRALLGSLLAATTAVRASRLIEPTLSATRLFATSNLYTSVYATAARLERNRSLYARMFSPADAVRVSGILRRAFEDARADGAPQADDDLSGALKDLDESLRGSDPLETKRLILFAKMTISAFVAADAFAQGDPNLGVALVLLALVYLAELLSLRA